MERFGADWLALREPADQAARALGLTALVARAVRGQRPLRILDLATGTGSNIRHVSPHLGDAQDWLAVDADEVLLAELPRTLETWAHARGMVADTGSSGLTVRGESFACDIERRTVDLSATLPATLFQDRRLVTASALLDLVSDIWLQQLADRCRDTAAAVLFGLNYNGVFHCTPEEPADEMVRDLVNRHQRTDKGFGPALGSDATDAAERAWSARGYIVRRERSDWVVAPEAAAFQRQLVDGWAAAAANIDPAASHVINEWRRSRLAHISTGRSTLIVGHEDLGAWVR